MIRYVGQRFGTGPPGATPLVRSVTFQRFGEAMSQAASDGGERRELRSVPCGASLVVRSGFYEGLEVCLDRDWTVIGRGRGADVVIAEPTISRAHAAIGFDAEGFFVQDLGSTNRTLVNGQHVQRQLLKNGDEIQMGKLVVGVTLPSGA